MKTTKLIEKILLQLDGKTFHSPEQVNDFFKESLERVAENAIKDVEEVLDSIDTLPDMIHPTTGDDYRKLWSMIQKRINDYKSLNQHHEKTIL